jgi:hypothetical protein
VDRGVAGPPVAQLGAQVGRVEVLERASVVVALPHGKGCLKHPSPRVSFASIPAYGIGRVTHDVHNPMQPISISPASQTHTELGALPVMILTHE